MWNESFWQRISCSNWNSFSSLPVSSWILINASKLFEMKQLIMVVGVLLWKKMKRLTLAANLLKHCQWCIPPNTPVRIFDNLRSENELCTFISGLGDQSSLTPFDILKSVQCFTIQIEWLKAIKLRPRFWLLNCEKCMAVLGTNQNQPHFVRRQKCFRLFDGKPLSFNVQNDGPNFSSHFSLALHTFPKKSESQIHVNI